MKRYEKYGRNPSWIVKKYGNIVITKFPNSEQSNKGKVRKTSWILKRYGNYGRKVSWILKRFGKYRRKLWKDMENMEEK